MAILGIDEVGRGPLAGPLVVGAVILPERELGCGPEWVGDLKDSKQLTAKKREKLAEVIWAEAPAVGLGWVSPAELDAVGVTGALELATRRAVKTVQGCGYAFSEIVIDGKINFLKGTTLERYVTTVVRADNLIKEVSAASIVAKVARDAYMVRVAERFPGYGFEKNMGYGTAVHLRAIAELGASPEHRRSFEPIKSLVGFSRPEAKKKNTNLIGAMGEAAVSKYLEGALGHTIVARNFKTYFYEIDIISTKGDKIYFTEVKYRKNSDRGGGFAAIDRKKITQMKYAAECFLMYYRHRFGNYDPLLAVSDVVGENFEVKDWLCIGE